MNRSGLINNALVNIFKNRVELKKNYTSEGLDTLREIGLTLDKPQCFLVHLLSREDFLGGSLVKSGKILCRG